MSVTFQNVRGGDPTDGHTVTFDVPTTTVRWICATAGPNADLAEYGFVLMDRSPERSYWRMVDQEGA